MPGEIIIIVGVVFLLVGTTLWVAARLASRTSDAAGDQSVGGVLRILFWVLLGWWILACLTMIGLGSLLLWVVLPVLIVEIWFKRRAAQQQALLWVLTVSAERSLPLTPAIEAFAREGSGRFARKARRLAAMLSSGVPLPAALQRCRGLLPWRALPLVWVGEGSGALAPALRRAASIKGHDWQTYEALSGKLAYLCVVPFFGFVLLSFVMLKIVPSFVKIFQDFGTQLPPMTRALIAFAHGSANVLGIGLFLGLPLLLVLFVYASLRSWRGVPWELPGMGWLMRRADTALVFEALALAAESRRPLTEAIAILARWYPKASIRQRLSRVLQDVDCGGDWCDSLLRRGLMRQADHTVLQAAQRVGNLAWALGEMADSNRRRLNYRMYALVQILFPPVIITMGLAVMFLVVSLFLPLISLISKLAEV